MYKLVIEMNKNKFQKQLLEIEKNNSFSLYFIENLFKKEKRSLFNNEKIETLIEDNFHRIMNCSSRGNVDSFINTLYDHESMRPFLQKEETIKYILDNTKYDDFELIISDSSINRDAQAFIHNNIDYALNNYSLKKIIAIYEHLKLNEKETNKIDSYFNIKKEEFLTAILTKTLSTSGNVDEKQLNSLINIVTKTVDKVLEKENCKITDIKILLSGGFSSVIQIGDMIVKVGLPRKTFDIPNDKRILQPYLRKDLSKEYGVEAVIEVSDRVDTDISLSENELYEIYKDMRNRGVVCGDFKYSNVGKLIKPNISHSDKANGMIGEVSETLNSGEYVIFDTDFIYNENDPNIDLTSNLSSKFENRYILEQQKKENKVK